MANFDQIDAHLLEQLQENGRRSQHDLARAVGLSAPAVADRLRKLEERGVIRGYTVLLDARRVGQDVLAYISVGMSGSKQFGDFRQRVQDVRAIQECHAVTGQAAFLLKVRVPDTEGLEHLLAEVQSWPGVQWTRTSLALSTVKESTAVALRVAGDSGVREEIGPAALLHVPFRHHP